MADKKNMSASEINRRMKREMDAARKRLKDEGFDPIEIDNMMRDYFVQKKSPAKKKTMTAAKGGMAISTTRAKQIRKNFRKNYGPKPKVTTADVKGRRRAVKAGQTTYMKKDGTTGQLTREQKLRTMQNLNKTAKKKKAGKTKPPRYGQPGEMIGPVMERPTESWRALKKKRPGSAKMQKLMRGGMAKKKMRGGGMVKAAAKKKMMRGGMAKKKK